MAKYTFTCQHTDLYGKDIDKIVYEREADTLTSVLEAFENFLKGSGFVFDGVLDIVQNEWDEKMPNDYNETTMVTNPWPFQNDTVNVSTVHHEDRI